VKVGAGYAENGYALVEGLIAEEVAQVFLRGIKDDLFRGAIPLTPRHPRVLKRPALEIYGGSYLPLQFFLLGLTPLASSITGRDLLPTYNYFRLYRQGDVCRVHADRHACEHSMSLTLAYSDGEPWDLQVGRNSNPEPTRDVADDFGGEAFASLIMRPGDAVLYQGVGHRHGRTAPNPNRWSAHLFLHWIDREGPHRDQAFDGSPPDKPVDFTFT